MKMNNSIWTIARDLVHLLKPRARLWHSRSTSCATSAQKIAVIGSLASPFLIQFLFLAHP